MPLPQAAPLELPRLLLRHALLAAAAALSLAVLLGMARMASDIDDEVDSAAALAALMARLAGPQPAGDREMLVALAEAQRAHPLRHLELRITGPQGRLLLGPPAAQPAAWPMRALVALHQRWLPPEQAGRHTWTLQRPDGQLWTASLATSRESERIEALSSLIGALGLLLGCVALMLLVMHWKARQSLRPMAPMLGAIGRLEGGDLDAVAQLPAMPIRELEAMAGALRHLAASLGQAEAERRMLSRKVLTLQEDERVRLARELHDEMGQQLTALRVDAAWLDTALARDAALQAVARGIDERCAQVQSVLRGMLARLQPLGGATDGTTEPTLAALVELLRQLVDDWSRTGAQATEYTLRLRLRRGDAADAPLDTALAAQLPLPREIVQSAYRIAQEALTNVARHARARRAMLALVLCLPADGAPPGAPGRLECTVCDDGVGLHDVGEALRRGNGLGGIQERVWACAGEIDWHAGDDERSAPDDCSEPQRWPGLCLRARLPLPARATAA